MKKILLAAFAAIAAVPGAYADEEGWGIRFGFADDPDQAVVGAQYDVGEVADHIHVVPMFEIGFGDDATTVSVAGMAFWLLFGFMIWNWPMIVANTITLALALTILRLKLKYG